MCLSSVWILSEVDIENTRLRPVTLSDVYIVNFQHDFGYWMVALFLNTLLWAVFLYVWPSNSGGGGGGNLGFLGGGESMQKVDPSMLFTLFLQMWYGHQSSPFEACDRTRAHASARDTFDACKNSTRHFCLSHLLSGTLERR